MLKAVMSACVFAGFLGVAVAPIAAQEVIHALTGTITTIDNAGKTITVLQDDGKKGLYQDLSNPKKSISFDKRIAAETTAANAFSKQGAYAIVFYFGNDDDRTAVALKGLGDGPFSSVTGTVTRFDPRGHTISVEDTSGATQTLRIDAQTVAEGGMGVIEGLKFQAQSGDKVRVVSGMVNGASTVLFIRQL